MTLALLIARLLLSVVFLVAGLAKLADLPGSQNALHNFGVPEALAKPMGIILPITEIAVAVALVSLTWAWYGALGALVLLLIFIAGISYNLARGRSPDCHCFGQLHSAPAGPSTIARNAFLALVAALVAWFGRGNTNLSATNWFTTWPLAQQITLIIAVIGIVLIVGESWLLLQMLSQQGRLLLRAERLEAHLAQAGIVLGLPEQELPMAGLPIGTRAPAFSGKDLGHETISLAALRAIGKPIVLIFINPACGLCSTLMPEVGRWQRDYANWLTVALLSRGSIENNRAKASENHLLRLLIQNQDEIDKIYNVQETPSAVLIHPDGLIDSHLAVGPENIRVLVERCSAIVTSVERPIKRS